MFKQTYRQNIRIYSEMHATVPRYLTAIPTQQSSGYFSYYLMD
jgi:hypothetical protein